MVELIHVYKKIGRRELLSDINFIIPRGTICGLSGANGSGKTLIMKIISGLYLPSSGQVKINGKISSVLSRFPESIGIFIENPEFIPSLTGYENLKMIADIKKIISSEEIKKVMCRVGLDINDDKKFKNYSLGMKQKLGIAAAIMEKPDLIILDEPFNAIDKVGIGIVKSIIAEEKKRGATIILASHNNDLFDELVDMKIEIAEGRVIEIT